MTENELRRLIELGITPEQMGFDPMTGGLTEPGPQQNELAAMIQQAGSMGQDVLTAPQAFTASGRQTPTVNGDFQVYAGEGRPKSIDLNPAIEQIQKERGPQQPQQMRSALMGSDGIFEDRGQVTNERPEIDYSRPGIEIAGQGKGQYTKDGRVVIQTPQGPKLVTMGVDRAAMAQRAKDEFQKRFAEQKLQAGELDMERGRAELDAMRQPKQMKAPDGFRWKQDGSLEPIPGGPAAMKQGESAEKQDARKQAMLTGADVVLGKVDEALGKTGWSTAGMVGGVMRNVPGSDAFDLNKTVDTLKARIGFDTLAAMREASPTGGALGQVAVQELAMLQSTIASLDTAQSPEQLRQSLEAVREHYNNWKKTLQGGQEQPQQPQSGAPKVGEVRKGYRFKGGDPGSKSSWEKV